MMDIPISRGTMPMNPDEQVRFVEFIGNFKPKRVLEFGSGRTTELLWTMNKLQGFPESVHSIEHDPEHGCAVVGPGPVATYVTRLLQWDEVSYRSMLELGRYSTSGSVVFSPGDVPHPSVYRTPNVFYELTGLARYIVAAPKDLVILDGWAGNGRNIGIVAIKNIFSTGGHLWIHDAREYGYIETAKRLLDVRHVELFEQSAICTIGGPADG